ncbi:SRPBCC domain-containing protein [Dyadobacter sp. 676]|uniref:SRPBCC domain-containing protein n=1 Tax=Dyadobacter sp. 676 TaxID=3088362 RepID=A0AAU8FMD0_9BACT
MPNIRQSLLIAATAKEVYDALTTSEGLSSWWTPGASAAAVLNSSASFPFGDSYLKKMRILELKPLEFVKWHCVQGDSEWVGTTIGFRLLESSNEKLLETHPEVRGQVEQSPAARGVLLTCQHDDWDSYTPMFAECSYTWGAVFEEFETVLRNR